MPDLFSNYINNLVESVLSSVSYQSLSAKDKKSLSKTLQEHFWEMAIETFLNRINSAQAQELRSYLKNPRQLEQKMEQMAATTAGLATEIQERLEGETERLKALGI